MFQSHWLLNALLQSLYNVLLRNIAANHRRQSLGVGCVATPIFWAGDRGRVVKYYYNLIMYRKYVKKWILLKRSRIICPEVAVNGQFCLDKRKKRSFGNFCLSNRNCLVKLPEKIGIFGKSAWKNRFFFTWIHDPLRFSTRLTPLLLTAVILHCTLGRAIWIIARAWLQGVLFDSHVKR